MISTADQQVKEDTEKAPIDDHLLVAWLETREETFQIQFTDEKLEELLSNAAQPRHASGNACIKLCYFIEQCRKSKSDHVRQTAYSLKTCLGIFDFFIDWNEKNQNRSMRQVLELLASLISQHPQKEVSASIKVEILKRLTSIISHRAAQPLVKPAFKSLECFLGKGPACISPHDLIEILESGSNQDLYSVDGDIEDLTRWDPFISGVFDWMTLPDISPAAGKCLVTLFGQLRKPQQKPQESKVDYTVAWQRWIRNGLIKNPAALENVKNYLFPPLFKLDRPGSLAFLEDLNKQKPMSDLQVQEFSAQSLLQLAAIEVGKKAGLVEEPSMVNFQNGPKKSANTVILQEAVIGPLLKHADDTVRSLAFSVLVSSFSSIRPFNAIALEILQSGMGLLYADTDAKFRNEVLSNTRHMISRIRGATAYLVREIQHMSFTSRKSPQSPSRSLSKKKEQIEEMTILLRCHEDFLQWYLQFLLGELIPTASYQRHVTSLKAITIFLMSGILFEKDSALDSSAKDLSSSVWPFSINFFTSGAMRLLLDLLMDPFEDVRINAASVLKFASRECFELEQTTEYAGIIPRNLVSSDPTSVQQPQNSLSAGRPTSEDSQVGLLRLFISRAEEISKKSGRADYADGLARCYALLYNLLPCVSDRLQLLDDLVHDLEKKTSIAKADLTQAVSDAPLHGTFAALNFIWESINAAVDGRGNSPEDGLAIHAKWTSLQGRILISCVSVWRVVKNVLCNDSPEGHLPDDLDEVPSIDTKDILSYSFRAVHESSNLMRTMTSMIKRKWENGHPILPTDVFLAIGHLTFEQLSTLRHRGAFSTVSLTFSRCCQAAQHQDRNSLADFDILDTWYEGAKACIFDQASTTRRSAGIPALITGILASNSLKPRFEDVLAELISLARQPVSLTKDDRTNLHQVHAMNSLKEIFKSSILGKKAETHLAECLQLAADSLTSDIWAIRNCGLLLLRSLIDCLFGTSESKSVTEAGWDGRSIRLSYENYPSLPELLLKLLDTDTSTSTASSAPQIGAVESVFPALDIIRRAGPPSTHRADIYRCVSMHLGSKIWHVREIAARTICTLFLHQNWLQDSLALISTADETMNRTHGVLLAVKFILERRLSLDQNFATEGILDIDSVLKGPIFQDLLGSAPPEVLASYLEVYNSFAKICLSAMKCPTEAGSDLNILGFKASLFPGNCLEDYERLMSQFSTSNTTPRMRKSINSLLEIAIVRRGIYGTAISADVDSLQQILRHAAGLNPDITLAAIECVAQAWGDCPRSAVIDVVQAYYDLARKSESSEICSVTISRMAEMTDKLLGSAVRTSESDLLSDEEILKFHSVVSGIQESMSGKMGTPSLGNAEIRVSGCVVLFKEPSLFATGSAARPQRQDLESWGLLLSLAGEASNDFDTRFAAAAALATFYGSRYVTASISGSGSALPSLFALYDTLNDDDDEIRDLSAKTVSKLIGTSVVPLAARGELAMWMSRYQDKNSSFAWNTVRRMTGHCMHEPMDSGRAQLVRAGLQFQKAMKDDDSLFVEEEQNLFIDEIREAELWCTIFEQVDLSSILDEDFERAWGRSQEMLADWVLHGLEALNQLLKTEDGPLGWSSKPAVFAICMRVLMSANSILRRQEVVVLEDPRRGNMQDQVTEEIVMALKRFLELGHEKKVHDRLLFEVEARSNSPLCHLERIAPGVSGK